MRKSMMHGLLAGLKTALLASVSMAAMSGPAWAGDSPGAVYTLTNAAANAVAVFKRGPEGTLTPAGTYLTGGQGTAAGLGSEGALALSGDGLWLVAVNAASNDVTLFAVREDGLQFRARTSSGGIRPISVTMHDNLVYVVNAGGTPNISGLRVLPTGGLEPIPGSTMPLGGQNPAQVAFNPAGDTLVVTAKTTNTIDVFQVYDGVPSAPTTVPSSGQTPFGFAFDTRDHIIVSEAFGGAPGATAVSSYELTEQGGLQVVTPSLQSGQSAACWVVVTRKGRFAYAANTPSATITGFSIDRNGMLQMLAPNGISAALPAGSAPTDMAVSRDDRFLYNLNAGSGTIRAWRIEMDGSLSYLGAVGGLPAGTVGLAAR